MAEGTGRKLVLLRHAKSAWPDVPDHERPLADRGRRDAPTMGRWLHAAGHVPDHVLCSTARRARETWHLVQPELLAAPPVSFESQVYEASAASLLKLAQQVPPAVQTLLIIGHDPGVPGLARTLAGGSAPAGGGAGRAALPPAVIDRMRVTFPTAAIAVLELAGPWTQLGPRAAWLADFVTPRDVRSSPG